MRRLSPSAERGSATVLVLGVVLMAGILLGGIGLLTGAQANRGAAQTAADLAALAGADVVMAGGDQPCAVAQEVAARNKAHVESCEVFDDGVVQVRTSRVFRAAGATVGTAATRARAGPAWLGPMFRDAADAPAGRDAD